MLIVAIIYREINRNQGKKGYIFNQAQGFTGLCKQNGNHQITSFVWNYISYMLRLY